MNKNAELERLRDVIVRAANFTEAMRLPADFRAEAFNQVLDHLIFQEFEAEDVSAEVSDAEE